MIRTIIVRVAIPAAAVAAFCGIACNDDEVLTEPSWFYITEEQGGLPSNTVYGVYADETCSWFATGAGLAYNDGSEWVIYDVTSGMPAEGIFGLAVLPNGDVWIGTYLGAALVHEGEVTPFGGAEGLPSNWVNEIVFDGEKVWFATRSGLARYDDPGFTVINSTSGLPGDDVWDVYAVGVDQVWAACIGGAAFYDHGTVSEYTTLKNNLPSDNVYTVAARDDETWIGTDRGLALFRDGEFVRTYDTGNSVLKADIINDIAYRANGEVWVATAGGGVARSYGGGFVVYDRDRGLLSNYARCVYGDKLGYMWVGTLDGGVNRFND
jgi:ligand-binding sensor domain-containing protein